MTFTAYRDGKVLSERTYYSIGGGFVLDDDESGHPQLLPDPTPVPYPFRTGTELLDFCDQENLSISQVMLANECVRRPEAEVRAGLLKIWAVMQQCIQRGCTTPGCFLVASRYGVARQSFTSGSSRIPAEAKTIPGRHGLGDAVGAGSQRGKCLRRARRTAPTNGAAGIIPAVLHYAVTFVPGTDDDAIVNFLLVAGALGAIYSADCVDLRRRSRLPRRGRHRLLDGGRCAG